MIEPNILAFQNGPLLAALDERPPEGWTRNALAAHIERDPSNTGRALKALVDAGLTRDNPLTEGLTDEGRAQLAAYKRAQHGGERKRARGQWPLDRFKQNPLNRPVRREALHEMAASMRGPAGLVQRVRATEPDANGVRMLIDGEHRWEAAKLVAAQVAEEGVDVPDWLADGLPFEEGTADPATALIITLVANARRADMSPWDDAQQLLKLQKATDWSASELARQIGRVSEGERTGLRDVQQKLKIAREATPEAVAEYERTGSWDTLRASVTTPKPPRIGEQVAQHGAAVLNQTAQAGTEPEIALADEPLSPAAELALVEIVWAMLWTPFNPPGQDAAVLTDGYYYMSEGMGLLVSNGLIDYLGWDLDAGRACVVRPTAKGMAWAEERFDRGAPNLSQLIAWREKVGIPAGRREPAHGDDEGFYTSTLNTAAKRKHLLSPKPALTGPHVVNGVDYGNATRANDARRALGLLPPLPTPNYGSSPRPETRPGPPAQTPAVPVSTPEDDQRPVTPEQDAPAPVTRDAPPALPPASVMSAHLKALIQSREHPTNAALRLIADERKRQVEAEGFTPETDDRDNADLELAYGAAAYAASAAGDADASLFWPSGWNPYLFKPTGDVRDLVRAGALIVAELERRAREAAASHPALLETVQ